MIYFYFFILKIKFNSSTRKENSLQSSLFMQNFYIRFSFVKLLYIIVDIFSLNTKMFSYIADTPTWLASSFRFLKTKKELQKNIWPTPSHDSINMDYEGEERERGKKNPMLAHFDGRKADLSYQNSMIDILAMLRFQTTAW